MRRASLVPTLVGAVAVTTLIGCLLAILVTGPVVVRVSPLDLRVEPSPSRLKRDVETLCSQFHPRDHRHTDQLDAAAVWIARQFEEAGLDVRVDPYQVKGRVYRNVIGRRQGTDPAPRTLVIGAHYDALEGVPGADDNASGVAVLLELARTLPAPPGRRSLMLAAFSTEEPPFFGTEEMGSHHLAQRLYDEGVDVELMVSLDCIGYFSDAEGSQALPWSLLRPLYPDRGDFIGVVGDLRAGSAIGQVKRGLIGALGNRIEIHSFRSPASLAPVDHSDHLSFRRHGFPAVQVTDTAFMRNPHYHRPEDTPDRLDYERMALVVLGLHGLLWEPPSR